MPKDVRINKIDEVHRVITYCGVQDKDKDVEIITDMLLRGWAFRGYRVWEEQSQVEISFDRNFFEYN